MSSTSAVEVSIHEVSPLSGMASAAQTGLAARSGSARVIQRINLLFIDRDPSPKLNGAFVLLAGADADDLLQVEDEYLAVADFSGARGVCNGFDHLFGDRLRDRDLDFGLGHEFDGIFGATVDFGVPALAPEAFHFGDGDALHANIGDGGADIVELERLDDGSDEFHGVISRSSC